jgi:hypothetical protein
MRPSLLNVRYSKKLIGEEKRNWRAHIRRGAENNLHDALRLMVDYSL